MKFLKIFIIWLLSHSAAWALEDDFQQPIYIEANSATYDDKKGESVYHGDVQATQGSMRVNADHMIVYITPDKKIDRIIATGNPVRFKQTPEQGKEDIKGKSLRAEYYGANSLLILLEDAVLWQGENTYASDRIEYDSKNAIVKAGEKSSNTKRVHVTLQPKKE